MSESTVENHATTFDPLDPALAEGDPVAGERFWGVMSEMQTKCPVARTEAHGGFYYLTKHEDIRQAAADWETFSSALRGGSVIEFSAPEPLLPLDADPPLHRQIRKLMGPYFTPKAAQQSAESVRRIVNEAIDGFAEADRCEFVAEFANVVAPRVVFECVFGLPPSAIEEVAPLVEPFVTKPEATAETMPPFAAWCDKMLADRRGKEPRGDLMDMIVHGKLDGETPLTPSQQVTTMIIFVGGGLETVALGLGNIARHLAVQPELFERLKSGELDVALACEEFLRFEAPAPHMGRAASRDVTLRGVEIPSGERVILGFGAAGRDPEVFECPEELRLDRPNAAKHLAFGAGPHMCPGAHLARVELQVALQEMLRRFPPFGIAEGEPIEFRTATTRGVKNLPLIFSGPIVDHPLAAGG